VPPTVDSFYYQIMDFFIFTVLSWYFYNILPNEKGLSPWFFLDPTYWIPGSKRSYQIKRNDAKRELNEDQDIAAELENALKGSSDDFLVIELKKEYKKYLFFSGFYALKGISLCLQKNQVFALLGHNGAGKTTAVNVLTGCLRPTSGDVMVFGLSIHNKLSKIQKNIGVCPQYSILFEELTAKEHLELFADIKMVPRAEQPAMIEARLKDVLLLDVANKQAGKFSGGMKRRLSVAIAAMGNPQIIYLDEPTTGLDPSSRREIWNSIQRLKKNRIIFLTTHSMEEADILGDRIAVMASGKLRCLGTSLHLKNKFGLGYRLNLTCLPGRQEELKQLVHNMIPNYELISATGEFFIYGLQTSVLPSVIPFFELIEENRDKPEFIIRDWGISQTTLEEVFLRVTHEAEKE